MAEPRWLKLARGELGVHEIPGPKSNPRVERYYADAIGRTSRDDVPWCAAFVGAMLRRSGIEPSNSLLARSYLRWGQRLGRPKAGCIVVLARGGPATGHVGFYVDSTTDGEGIYLLGGNQSDAVTIERTSKRRVLGYRWPIGAQE